MARYSASFSQITCTAFADGASHTTGAYPGSLRQGATTYTKINEVYVGGESSASTPTTLVLARGSLLSVGALSNGGLALLDALAVAPGTLPNWGSTAATTYPQRATAASGAYLLDLSLNTYGGIARWQARYGEEITVFGASTPAVPAAEVILSSKSGAGIMSGHILFEQV